MKKEKLLGQIISAIDVGSNAIRMIIADHREDRFYEIKKFRSPVRLGRDVFEKGTITEETLKKTLQTFRRFSQLNKKYKVSRCRAVATSATREAQNKLAFVERILQSSGIQVEIIDGLEEARLIYLAVHESLDLQGKNVLVMDIGGGSVEVTLSQNSKMKVTQSFPLGTVRILDHLKKRNLPESSLKTIIGDLLPPLSQYLEKNFAGVPLDFAVGTGGNLECMARLKARLLKKTPATSVTLQELSEIADRIKNLSVKERIEKLELRSDRADVILPAIYLVKTVLRQSSVEKIYVPGVGLRDGLLWTLVNN